MLQGGLRDFFSQLLIELTKQGEKSRGDAGRGLVELFPSVEEGEQYSFHTLAAAGEKGQGDDAQTVESAFMKKQSVL